ncbi:SCO4225 family membrane protein [Streptomyces sp. NPDC055089]
MTGADTASSPRRSVPRRLLDHLGVAALVYLGVCAVLLAWALVVDARETTDASMAGVIPFLATAPGSLAFLMLPANSVWFLTAIAVGAAVNAAIIGWCTRALRRGGRPDL